MTIALPGRVPNRAWAATMFLLSSAGLETEAVKAFLRDWRKGAWPSRTRDACGP